MYECVDARGEGVLLDIHPKDRLRCLAFLEHVAGHGPEVFADNRTHHVGEEPKIWQFDVVGKLRLLYFYDEGKVVVLSKSFYKEGGKSGKTPKQLIKAAQLLYREYLAAKLAGTLVYLSGVDDGD